MRCFLKKSCAARKLFLPVLTILTNFTLSEDSAKRQKLTQNTCCLVTRSSGQAGSRESMEGPLGGCLLMTRNVISGNSGTTIIPSLPSPWRTRTLSLWGSTNGLWQMTHATWDKLPGSESKHLHSLFETYSQNQPNS